MDKKFDVHEGSCGEVVCGVKQPIIKLCRW